MYTLTVEQHIPAPPGQVWDFISSPRNLQRITPAYMGFEIRSTGLPDKIYEGLMIHYTVRPLLSIPMQWVTEITHVKEGTYFVDEQRMGPYSMWHHEHHLRPVPGGVLMLDMIHYIPPFGWLGQIAQMLFIRWQLKGIFEFRKQKINEIFGEWKGSLSH